MITHEQIELTLRGCLANDRASQRALYEHFYGYGMSIGLRYSNNEDDAVTILNDGFMKAFKHLKNFDISKPFKPWFRRILVNTAIDHYNRKLREPYTTDINDVHEADRDQDILSGINYEEILELMRRLPPSYRMVFNLHIVEGYSHEEIAEKLGVSTGTTKSNLFKAKKKMQEMLEEHFTVS